MKKLSPAQIKVLKTLAEPGAFTEWQGERGYRVNGQRVNLILAILEDYGFVGLFGEEISKISITPTGREYLAALKAP